MIHTVLAGFPETFKTVLGVLLALMGTGVGLMGMVATADKSWKGGLTYVVVGVGLLAVGLRLAGALSSTLDSVLGVVIAVFGLIFLGLGLIALPGPTRTQGLVSLAGGAAMIAGGLWMMNAI